jgi:hypothetical protein
MPIKLFLTGEVLDADEVNTYFMQQALVVFDDATARDAAFGGAGEPTLTEGRFCYLKDDKTIYIYTKTSVDPDPEVFAWTAQVATITDGAVTSVKLASDLDLNGTTEIDEILETVVVNSSALTNATFQVNAKSGAVQYFNAAAQTGNWVWNLRGDGTPTLLTTMMDNNQSITFSLFVKNGATAYYPTSITVDGAAPAVLRWFGGNVITAGNVNSVDCYTITVIKTASATFEVFASQSKFA